MSSQLSSSMTAEKLDITPWFSDEYMREIVEKYFQDDTPIEGLSRTDLEFEFEKLKWIWVRESLGRVDVLINFMS